MFSCSLLVFDVGVFGSIHERLRGVGEEAFIFFAVVSSSSVFEHRFLLKFTSLLVPMANIYFVSLQCTFQVLPVLPAVTW